MKSTSCLLLSVLLFVTIPCFAVNPVTHWALDETSGDIAYDSVGNNDGTLYGGPVWTAGQIAGGLSFDGVDDYVVSDGVCAEIAGDNFTITAWVKSDAVNPANQFMIAINTANGDDNKLLLGTLAGASTLIIYDGAMHDTGVTVIDGDWHHIACVVYDAANVFYVYIDGEYVLGFDSTVSAAGNDLLSLGQEYDGGLATGDFYQGSMDDVRVYDEALNGGDILSLYYAGLDMPVIGVFPNSFSFTVDDGGVTADQNLTIANIGVDTLNWTVSESCSWLSVSPASGSSTGEADDVALSVDVSGLSAGEYYCDLTITDPLAANSPLTVPVYLYVKGVVTHWALDETSGTTAHDPVGGKDGTLYGSPVWVDGQIGGALSFDGVDDYVVSDSVCGGIAGYDFTISAWIKSETVNPATQFILSLNTFDGDNRILAGTLAGVSTLSIYDGAMHETGVTVIDGDWHHIAYVVDDAGDAFTVYIDGVNVLSFPSTVSIAADDLLSLGQEYDLGLATGDFYKGSMDDVRVYNEPLSDADALELYENGISLLHVSPFEGFVSSGDVGGPFAPVSKDYQLTNVGGSGMDWDVQCSAGWVDVSGTPGTLAPGASTTVTVSINSNANALAFGGYRDDVIFRIITNPVDITQLARKVSLGIGGDLFVPTQYPSIQSAIDAAVEGDTIVVEPGRYSENINFNGKNIILSSMDPEEPGVVSNTIIDGGGTGSVVTFANREGPDAVITGFTITGGYGEVNPLVGEDIYWGAGIYCFDSSPTIVGNVLTGNYGPEDDQNLAGYGGGIGCYVSNAVISRNIIRQNGGFAGGGVLIIGGEPVLSNNLIYGNSAFAGGGVVLLGGDLINNTISGNSGEIGGNIYFETSDFGEPLIANNIIVNALSGSGMFIGGGTVSYKFIRYNNVWNNGGGNYDNMPHQTGVNGNISVNPLFTAPEVNDYHLDGGSPCINAGDNSAVTGVTDLDGNPRILNGLVDMGAYESFRVNEAPVADAGEDQEVLTDSACVAVVTLDGTGSSDADGDELSYYWYGGGELIAEGETPSIALGGGEHTITLIVSDGTEESEPDEVFVIVVCNAKPVADAGEDQEVFTGSACVATVTLDGSGSSDADGEELSYRWYAGGELIAEDETPSIDLGGGEHTITLIVNDGIEDSEPDEVVVTVVCSGLPVADAGEDQEVFGGSACAAVVTLDGSGSSDAGGGELSYYWYAGGDLIAEGETPSIALGGGEHTITLIVNNGSEDSEPDDVVVTVICDPVYVDDSAVGANDGTSWEDAFNELYDALDAVQPGRKILVGQGTYKPDTEWLDDPREATFQIKNGVTIEGGYAGYGADDPDERKMKVYETTLSGDLNGDDGEDFENYDDNSFHIVTFDIGVDASTILDRLTIRSGAADLDEHPNRNGGGIVNHDGDPTLTNCIIRDNRAYYCGGMMNGTGNPTLIGCTFMGNKALMQGGAFGYSGGQERGTLMLNCIISGNSADYVGGAISVDGGDLTMINCTLSENYSDDNTGEFIIDGANVTLTNCIVWGHSEPQFGWDLPVVTFSNIQGGWPGEGNINVNPLFVKAKGVDGIAGTQDDNLRLQAGSLCIDVGDNSAVTVTTDLDGNPRIINATVDMGAYEFNFNAVPVADAGEDQEVFAGSACIATVTLDGTGSSDVDGDDLSYRWYAGGELIAEGATPSIELGGGEHRITLIVNDGIEDSEPDEVVVTVVCNAVPVADAGEDQEVFTGSACVAMVTLDGSGSADADGDELSYRWYVGEKLFTGGEMLSIVLGGGEHRITLIVNDGIEDSEPDEVVVTVVCNAVPVADAGEDQEVFAGSACVAMVTLDGSGSTDANGDELSYRWYAGGELIAEGATPSIELGVGEHTITLIVNDGIEDSQADSVVIAVVCLPVTTPATVKSGAIDLLEGVKDGSKVDKELEKAIKHIEKSLGKTFKGPGKRGKEQNVWIDDSHLDPKHGKKVFDEEKKAAKVLMELIDGKGKKGRGRKGRGRKGDEDVSEEVKAACRAAIDKLIEADDMLASIAYDEALAGAGEPKVDKELEKCEGEFEKAGKELDKGKYDKAIDHYKHAWEHAQKAIKHTL